MCLLELVFLDCCVYFDLLLNYLLVMIEFFWEDGEFFIVVWVDMFVEVFLGMYFFRRVEIDCYEKI